LGVFGYLQYLALRNAIADGVFFKGVVLGTGKQAKEE
jgi:hypothetical protein